MTRGAHAGPWAHGRPQRSRPRKYGNVPTTYAGQVYDSAAEAHRAAQLDLLQRGGKILRWERATKVLLLDGGPGARVWYKPDFIVYADDLALGLPVQWAEDVKGVDRDTGKAVTMGQGFRIKAILWRLRMPACPLRVIDRDGNVVWRLAVPKR